MIHLIENPTAGSGFAKALEPQVKAWLNEKRIPYRWMQTGIPGAATGLAKQAVAEGTDAVLVLGGDGTASEAASGLLETKVPLGVIPAGTGNDFRKTVGTPKDPMEALAFIFSHQPRPLDVGLVNDRAFLNLCGVGFDVTVLQNTMEAKKYARGLTPYLIGLFKAIRHYRPIDIELTLGGRTERRQVLICAIGNGRFCGGGIPLCPSADPNDGKLNAMIVRDTTKWGIVRRLPALLGGKLEQISLSEPQLCDGMVIRCPGMTLNVDGELSVVDEARFSLLPGGLMYYW